ncbi:MAG: hypothetical protein Q9216_000154 [Gyalolechia sp. 2 TL-2023]
MPKSKGKRKRSGQEGGINTPQLESQVATVETPEHEAIASRLDQYFDSVRRLSLPLTEPLRSLSFPNIPSEYDVRCISTIMYFTTHLTALTPLEIISGLSSLVLYVDKLWYAIENYTEKLQSSLGQPNLLRHQTSHGHNWYGHTVKSFLGDLKEKLFFYPRHVFAAYKRHPEFRGSNIFSHCFLSIALVSLYLKRHSVLPAAVVIIKLPLVLLSTLVGGSSTINAQDFLVGGGQKEGLRTLPPTVQSLKQSPKSSEIINVVGQENTRTLQIDPARMEFGIAVSSPSKNLVLTPDDTDLTPKPLRINKRKRQNSDHSYRGRSSRTSSSSGAVDLSPQPAASSRAGHGGALDSLNVRKQRHSHTAHVNLATDSFVPAAKFRRCATMSYPPPYDHNEAALPLPSARSLSLAAPPRESCALRVAHSPQQPLSGSRERWPEFEDRNLSAVSNQAVRREPSLKHRFLSRVMSSLISRPGSNHSVPLSNSSRRCSTEMSAENKTADSFYTTGRRSISTTNTESSIDTDLQTALDAFPEPPMSNLTSPTEVSSFEHVRHGIRADRVLCAPSDIAVIRPEVTIVPESETLDANATQNMYVAVQISAVMEPMARVSYDRSYGLDVAVIIDNSQFASPATLMASCETARFLSSLLDPSNDRMAIICTSSISKECRDLRTILPLSLANPRKTKVAVDTITRTAERPNLLALDAAVRSARALLEQSTPRNQNSELGPFAFGHVFILTPNSTGIAPEMLVHDTIQLHLVCAGSVPWKGEARVTCNGWKLQSMHTTELQSVSCSKDEDPASFFNRLRTSIDDARKGLSHGAIGDLILDIGPGQNCTIEGVIGTRRIQSLQRGEKVMALVRLKVGLPAATGYTLTPGRQRDGSSPTCHDLDKEFDKLLGTTPVTILNVKLKYKHSLLGPDTQCTLSTECRLKRQLHPSEWKATVSRAVAKKQSSPQAEIQKRFAYHIATHHAPRQAMMVLIEDFGDGGRRSACQDYIRLLIEELKYQARTIERFDLVEYRSGPIVATPQELRHDIWGEEHFGQGLFDASNYKPLEWIMDAPDEIMVQLPLSPLKRSEYHHHRLQSGETEKRTVLKRKPKRQAVRGSGGENRSSVSTELDEATRRLKDLALKNQRSLGADTSKCLAYP